MAENRCHYCLRPATEECRTCGRLYCAEHGEDVCLRCLSPEAATPSASVFRGALLALAVGTVISVFLVVSPPSSESSQDAVRTVITPTPAVSATATPTPQGTGTPPATATTPATGTATGTAPASPTAGPRTHEVAAGENLSLIADLYDVSVDDLIAANPGLTEEIQPGQIINIPGTE